MLDILVWLIAAEILGLVAFPLAFGALRWLPDRGYSLAKALGLPLVFYPLWILGSTTVIPNSLWTILFIIVAVALVSLVTVWLNQNELAEFLEDEWRAILLTEAVFVGVFLVWVYIRAQDPAINHTEQPMDLAFLTTSMRSPTFPPLDPWLAGERVSYYYFGYLMMGGLTQLTGITSSIGYNLALALIPALVATGAFGIGSNLVRLVGGSLRASAVSGLVAVVLLLGVANLESGLELLRAGGVSSTSFWEWVDIKGLDGPSTSNAWYPSEPGWWWWRATRVIDTVDGGTSLDYTITEFPFFSFLLGDLHPHVMSIPFVLLTTGVVLNLFVDQERLGLRWIRRNQGMIALLTLSLGATGFINMWDLPTFVTLFGAATLLRAYRQRGTVRGAVTGALPVMGVVLPLALVLFLPFYGTFDSAASGILPVKEPVTRYFHFGIVWGLFLFAVVPYVVWETLAYLRHRPWGRREVALAVGIPLIPLGLWMVAPFVLRALVEAGLPFIPEELRELARQILTWDLSQMHVLLWERFVHLLPLLVLMAGAVYALLRRQRAEGSPAGGFPLILLALGFLLLVGPELFYVVDLFNNRMNTIFKLYYQVWVLLALASSYAIYYLGVRYARSGPVLRVAGYGWIALLGVALSTALYYPVASVYTKSSGAGGETTLDGLAYVERQSGDEYRAIQWLRENAVRGDRIVEAVGNDYIAETSRVSASTGIPTVLGWPGHEHQWRGSTELFEGREEAVRVLYQSSDPERVQEILQRYGVTYVYVGPQERTKYGTPPLERFLQYLEPVFPDQDSQGSAVRIYRVRG